MFENYGNESENGKLHKKHNEFSEKIKKKRIDLSEKI